MSSFTLPDPMRVSEFASATVAIRDGAALWDLLCGRMQDYGFDRLLYAVRRMPVEDVARTDDWVVLSSHAESYTRRLLSEDIVSALRMFDCALRRRGGLTWSELARERCDDGIAGFRLRELDRAHQVRAGVTMGFQRLPHATYGAIGLTAAPQIEQEEVDRVWRGRQAEIGAQLLLFHLRFLTLPFGPYRLTPRQREVLERVARGRTTQEVAAELSLTPATVDKHLRLAREALGVGTTTQAVMKATLFNLIFDD